MPDEPTPPADAPAYVIDPLKRQDAETLRELARYAERLAVAREEAAERELAEEVVTDEDDQRVRPADVDGEVGEDVSPKACLTTKTINDNDYYYWQWREGDSIKSKYHKPVSPER